MTVSEDIAKKNITQFITGITKEDLNNRIVNKVALILKANPESLTIDTCTENLVLGMVTDLFKETVTTVIEKSFNDLNNSEFQRERSSEYWFGYPAKMDNLSAGIGDPEPLKKCAQSAARMWQGGNQWSAWASYLSFFARVAQIPGLLEKFECWETLALCSGPRIMHSKFVIISDYPEILKIDDQNQPHDNKGPFARWRDGFELFSYHGQRVPAWIIRFPERITLDLIKKENNVETRRIMIEQYGVGKYLADVKAQVIDMDSLTLQGSACRALMLDPLAKEKWLVGTDGSTSRVYFMNVPDNVNTCKEAHQAISGFDESKLIAEC